MAFDLRMLGAFGRGLASGNTVSDQISGGFTAIADQRREQGVRNKTLEFLSQSPEISQAVQEKLLTPQEGLKLYFAQQAETKKAQLPENRYKTVGNRLFDLQTQGWISPPAGAAGDDAEYGLNPQYGIDDQGNPVILQLSKGGTSKQTPLPPGVSLSKEPIRLDAGTHFVLLDPITRQQIGMIPKDLAGAEEQKAVGDARGKSMAAAAGDYQAGQNALDLITSLRNDPDRAWGTGKSSVFNSIPGSPGYDYQKKVNQATSGAFLTAINQMRGLGALSNAEGQTATAAVTRMDTAMSEDAYMEALNDYEKVIKQGMARAQGYMQPGSQSGGAPAQGGAPNVDDLVRKYGG